MMNKLRKPISPEQAEELLPDGDVVHTFRIDGANIVGRDWPKNKIIQRFKTHGVELSGELARNANHGLCSFDDTGPLFIETRLTKK